MPAERGPSGTGHERPPVAVPGPAPVPHPDEDRHGPHPSTEGAADPVVSPADTPALVAAFNRHYSQVCRCKWIELTMTRITTAEDCVIHGSVPDPLDVLLAVGERDEQLLRELRALAAIAKVERERDRRQIARLTEALRFYADKSKWNYRIGGKQPRATYVSYRLAEEALRDVAVLADEEDARG